MTNNRTNALERDTLATTQRATEGTSPAAENARNQESATALAVTLSKLTATDVYLICEAAEIDPGLLLKR